MSKQKNLEEMSIEELNAVCDDCDEQLAEIREEKRSAAGVRRRRLEQEHAAYYGLDPESYQSAKDTAAEEGVSLAKVLGKARRHRSVQVVRATAVQSGVKVKKV